MNKISNLLWGILFVIIGVIFGLNALEITNIDIFFDGFWTLFIIIPCFIGLFSDNDKEGNLIGLVIGVCLLLACQDLIEFELILKLVVPFILVVIGLSFIFKDAVSRNIRKKIKEINKGKTTSQEYCATFSGQNISYYKEEFTGCSLSAVFGGVKCDLRDAIIKEDTIINASSIFGGITIYAPKDVDIKITSTPIFGGVSDQRSIKNKDAEKKIYINATCLFGGVEIK